MEKTNIYIGVDTGVNTGLAVWYPKSHQFIYINSMNIIEAMMKVIEFVAEYNLKEIRIEDARLWKYFKKGDESKNISKLQGAGSVKRDAQIWEDFCAANNYPYRMVCPNKAITKWDSERFKKQTGFSGKTNSHGRDAAMLVYNL